MIDTGILTPLEPHDATVSIPGLTDALCHRTVPSVRTFVIALQTYNTIHPPRYRVTMLPLPCYHVTMLLCYQVSYNTIFLLFSHLPFLMPSSQFPDQKNADSIQLLLSSDLSSRS